jgi:hypothetical protein
VDRGAKETGSRQRQEKGSPPDLCARQENSLWLFLQSMFMHKAQIKKQMLIKGSSQSEL